MCDSLKSNQSFVKKIVLAESTGSNQDFHNIVKGSFSLISCYENDLSSILASRRQQESLLIKNSALLTLSYARAYYSSSISEFCNEIGKSGGLTEEDEQYISKCVEDCALQYVQSVQQNSLKIGTEKFLETEPLENVDEDTLDVSMDNMQIKIDKASKKEVKFILHDGLDDCDVSARKCEISNDLTSMTPKFKTGEQKDEFTPNVSVKTPSKGYRPMKTLLNLKVTPYTPELDKNAAQKRSLRSNHRGKQPGRKKLTFSESKVCRSQKSVPELNATSGKKKLCLESLDDTIPSISQSSSSKLGSFYKREKYITLKPETKLELVKYSTVSDAKDNEYSAKIVADNKLQKFKPDNIKICISSPGNLVPNLKDSNFATKKPVMSFVRRNFLNHDGTPPSAHNSVEQSFLSPQSLLGKRLVFLKPLNELQDLDNKNFHSVIKQNSKVVVMKKIDIIKEITAKELEIKISDDKSNISKPSCSNLALLTKPCKNKSENEVIEANIKGKKRFTCNSQDSKDKKLYEIMDCQSPRNKRSKSTLNQAVVTPFAFMPIPYLGAPRKKNYSFRKSSPYCRRKLVKEFERLHIEVEFVDTPPGSPNDGLHRLPLLQA